MRQLHSSDDQVACVRALVYAYNPIQNTFK